MISWVLGLLWKIDPLLKPPLSPKINKFYVNYYFIFEAMPGILLLIFWMNWDHNIFLSQQ